MFIWAIWLSIFLFIGSAIADNVPFVFDENSSDLAGYNSYQLGAVSASFRDLSGIPPISSPYGDEKIAVTLVKNKSINQSSSNNNTTDSSDILSNLVALNRSTMDNATNFSLEDSNLGMPPEFSLVMLPTAASTNQDSTYWFKEGNINYDKGDYEKAISCYDQAIRLNRQFSGAWCNKGMALCRLEKYQEAIKAFDNALDLDPGYEKASNGKNEAFQEIGRENK